MDGPVIELALFRAVGGRFATNADSGAWCVAQCAAMTCAEAGHGEGWMRNPSEGSCGKSSRIARSRALNIAMLLFISKGPLKPSLVDRSRRVLTGWLHLVYPA